jgi:predicted lysophospholipase L1 biosynthesis ABC-type transport system permease subunit
MLYIYIGIRTIFFIAGITFIISQYYNIMKSSIKDYCILRGLGASKHNIQSLIFIQVVFLIIISIPVGLYCGYLLTGMIIHLLGNYTVEQNTMNWIVSTNTFYAVAGVTCLLIIAIGIYLEIGTRKMSISDIFSRSPVIDKEGL